MKRTTSYFFTVVTYRRRPILCDAPVREVLRDAIETVRNRHPSVIDAWVLLSDHLHCLWTLEPVQDLAEGRITALKVHSKYSHTPVCCAFSSTFALCCIL